MASSTTTILITGGNAGLGLQTIKSLLQSPTPYTILLGSRSLSKGTAAATELKNEFPNSHSTVTPIQIDIEDDESIVKAAALVEKEYGHVDVLINNAGGQFDHEARGEGNDDPSSIRAMWQKSWNTNVAGTHLTTSAFAPLLLRSSSPRLLFITSGTSSSGECGTSGLPHDRHPAKGWPKAGIAIPAYRASKAGLNMLMREWRRWLLEDGVKVWCVSPGFLATGLGPGTEFNQSIGAQDPRIGADFIRDVVEGKRDEDVGKVIRKNDVQPF